MISWTIGSWCERRLVACSVALVLQKLLGVHFNIGSIDILFLDVQDIVITVPCFRVRRGVAFHIQLTVTQLTFDLPLRLRLSGLHVHFRRLAADQLDSTSPHCLLHPPHAECVCVVESAVSVSAGSAQSEDSKANASGSDSDSDLKHDHGGGLMQGISLGSSRAQQPGEGRRPSRTTVRHPQRVLGMRLVPLSDTDSDDDDDDDEGEHSLEDTRGMRRGRSHGRGVASEPRRSRSIEFGRDVSEEDVLSGSCCSRMRAFCASMAREFGLGIARIAWSRMLAWVQVLIHDVGCSIELVRASPTESHDHVS
jgi:hypothetical protein